MDPVKCLFLFGLVESCPGYPFQFNGIEAVMRFVASDYFVLFRLSISCQNIVVSFWDGP